MPSVNSISIAGGTHYWPRGSVLYLGTTSWCQHSITCNLTFFMFSEKETSLETRVRVIQFDTLLVYLEMCKTLG